MWRSAGLSGAKLAQAGSWFLGFTLAGVRDQGPGVSGGTELFWPLLCGERAGDSPQPWITLSLDTAMAQP